MKKLAFILSLIILLGYTASSQACKITVEIQNNSHDEYYFTGHISDGLNIEFWNLYVGPGQNASISWAKTVDWYRNTARITEISFATPIVDYVGNDFAPYLVHAPNNPNYFFFCQTWQDQPLILSDTKIYYYRIESVY